VQAKRGRPAAKARPEHRCTAPNRHFISTIVVFYGKKA
jgi:hypothetical protein